MPPSPTTKPGYFGGGFYHHNRYAILTNVTFGNNTSTIGAGHAIYEESLMTVGQPGDSNVE